MENKCYFCNRTTEEVQEYIGSLKKEFMERPDNQFWDKEERDCAAPQFDRLAESGMGTVSFSAIKNRKRVVELLCVPICPICRGYIDTVANNLEFEIGALREDLDK